MAVAQIYTAVANDVITAARWNNEFGNIYNNGTRIAFPATVDISLNGFSLTLDASGVTTLASSAAVGLTLTPGTKVGTPGPGAAEGSGFNIAAHTFTDTATAIAGTAAEYSFVSIQQPTLAASNTGVVTTDAAALYIRGAPVAGTNETITNGYAIWVDTGNVRLDGNLTVGGTATITGAVTTSGAIAGTSAPDNFIAGFIYANNSGDATNDIDIGVGQATSKHATPASRVMLQLTSALTKRLDASWVTGTNQGGLSSSLTIGNNDYYIHVIRVAGVDDVGFDTSATAANLITDHATTHYRRIGWFKRVGGTIVAFHVYELSGGGIKLLWDAPTLDVDLATTLTTAERTDAAKVPLNFSTEAILQVSAEDAAATSCIYMYSPDATDTAPSLTVAPLATINALVANVENTQQVFVQTDASGLVAARANVATYDDYSWCTVGFNWSRRG